MQPFTHPTPFGLPQSPRATRPMLSPLRTSFPSAQDAQETTTTTPSSSSETLADTQQQQHGYHHRNTDSLIFINATIPLSPASSATSSNSSSNDTFLLDGLAPRKRNGFVRLFCCFGREERARRKVLRETQYEKVGEKMHWSEY